MKEKVLKNYYEKFCFLNGLIEKQLSDSENKKKFNDYGFDLIDEEDTQCKAFTKIQILDEEFPFNLNEVADMDPLEVFIQYNVKETNADTDTEFLDEFIEKFNYFCDKYRLPRKEVRPDILTTDIKYKFGLTLITRKKLVRNMDPEVFEKKAPKNEGFSTKVKLFIMKVLTFGRYVDKESLKGSYLIDEEQLNYHFDIILNSENQKSLQEELDNRKITTEQFNMKKEVIHKMIYQSYWHQWVIRDCCMILIQQLVTALCIVPYFLLILLQETAYSQYSIVDPEYLITKY